MTIMPLIRLPMPLTVTLVLMTAFFWAPSSRAQDSPNPEQRYHREIDRANRTIQNLEEELEQWAGKWEDLEDFGKNDLSWLKQSYQKNVEICRATLDAYRRGDDATGKRLQKESENLNLNQLCYRRYGARSRQQQNWPPESWVFDLETKEGDELTKASASQRVVTRRQASMAWARLAEALVPDADPLRLIELEDQAYAAEAEEQAAAAIHTLHIEVYYRSSDPKIRSPQLSKKLQSVEQWREAILSIHRDRAEVERRQREWDRTRRILNEEIADAYRQARDQQPRK